MTEKSAESTLTDFELLALLDARIEGEQSRVLADYLEHVAGEPLSRLKTDRYLQHGGKLGQSLFAHILDGIFVLDQLCHLFNLPEHEARVLVTAYTLHDINKLVEASDGLAKDATPEKIEQQLRVYHLDRFLPDYTHYLHDITTLARKHPGHTSVSGESLVRRNSSRYGLGLDRVEQLAPLVRALDVIDLSHTLDEQAHKATFLSHLNQFALETDSQFTFFAHRLDELRGALTNIFHNAVSDELREHHNLLPLLLYPNGIAYLCRRGQEPQIDQNVFQRIAARAAGELARMTGASFEEFIEVRPLGIKVDAKCLDLGRPFDDILSAIDSIVQRRSFKHEELAQKARERTRASFTKHALHYPDVASAVEALLVNNPIASSDAQMRIGELIRSYYIFLDSHFAKAAPDTWQHLYHLLELTDQQQQLLAFFDARMDRAYALARDLTLDAEEVYTRILEDGRRLMQGRTNSDPRVALFTDYLTRHTHFSTSTPTTNFSDSFRRYVISNHKQCVQCSEPLPTTSWMAADVRSDIGVQTFSNRLRGGPGEPKKQVCGVCQAQFLVERLSYPEIRGEHTIYLHLLPYAFLTRPFVNGLRQALRRLQRGDVRALWLDGDRAIQRYIDEQRISAPMLSHTRQGKAHVYGVYLPSHADALIGNLLILPINPAGETDTERFLFGLEYAMILQRYFGCRAVLSASPVMPFALEGPGDLCTDMTPLSCRGLVDRNVYRQFEPDSDRLGQLPVLWQQLRQLYTIKRNVSSGQDDPLPALVEALAFHPLGIFYSAEKLAERRMRDDRRTRLPEWSLAELTHRILPAVEELARSKGGTWMEQLSTQLRQLAQIAWKRRLIGRTLAKSSLMTALDEVLRKIGQQTRAVENDPDALKAATIADVFAYLERTSNPAYPAGKAKWEGTKEFVEQFYNGIYSGVYQNSTARLLSDEKLLRSAFMFYMREQIPRKVADLTNGDEQQDLSTMLEA
jgi:CRISPR-associated protein Csc3